MTEFDPLPDDARMADLESRLATTTAQNDRLIHTLREARDQIVALKEEVDRLAQPPTGFGTFLQLNDDGSVDVFTGGRKLRVNVSPAVEKETLRKGQEVILNEAMNVVSALGVRDHRRSGHAQGAAGRRRARARPGQC